MQWLSNKEVTGHEAAVPEFNIPDHVVSNADRSLSLTIPGRRYVQDNTLPESVEPLLGGILWAQNDPYNRLCPTVPGSDTKCATGCVATATAQVMKYHQWPKQGAGQNSYVSLTNQFELSADFSQSIYDWDNMLDDYSKGYTEQQGNAVARLMSDIGIAENMDYDQESGTETYYATYALATFFGYSKEAQMIQRDYYNYAEWNDLLKKELAASRPVVIGGSQKTNAVLGHEFVLDGYDKDGMYHINWGWGGMSNGYYDINILCPKHQGTGGSNAGYPGLQDAIVNCFPDKDGTSVAHPLLAAIEEPKLDGDSICFRIINNGLGTYVGKWGYVATIDDEIVASAFNEIKEEDNYSFRREYNFKSSLEDLGITPEMIGSKKCKVYPAYDDGTGIKVPLSKVAFQSYVLLRVDENGQIVDEDNDEDNANPICESLEITRNYAYYNVAATALVGNKQGKTFDRFIDMYITDENNEVVAVGSNFAFIDAGETAKLVFTCLPEEGMLMEVGKAYKAFLTYASRGLQYVIPGEKVTFLLKDPGPDPSLSYSDFALDKTVVEQGEELTVSFKIQNTGGFHVEEYYIFVFREGEHVSMTHLPVCETELPNGTTTFSSTNIIDYDEGKYGILVSKRGENGWDDLNTKYLIFNVKAPSTGVSNVASTPDSAHYYDLQGRRVANPSKGIYVKGGKKVILKQQLD
ncbi:MAG: C10 family peptidase, partial [Bacteroidales bacterium]|nr:C10 family peptidase [Bacteroidales bacterium]